jgi:hypothetical protein
MARLLRPTRSKRRVGTCGPPIKSRSSGNRIQVESKRTGNNPACETRSSRWFQANATAKYPYLMLVAQRSRRLNNYSAGLHHPPREVENEATGKLKQTSCLEWSVSEVRRGPILNISRRVVCDINQSSADAWTCEIRLSGFSLEDANASEHSVNTQRKHPKERRIVFPMIDMVLKGALGADFGGYAAQRSSVPWLNQRADNRYGLNLSVPHES